MNFRHTFFTLILLVWFADAATAATLNVIVGGIFQEAKACGINEAFIKSAVEQTIKMKSIGVSNSLTNPYLYVDFKVATTNDTCVAFVTVSIDGLSVSDNADSPIGGFRAPDSRATRLGEFGSIVNEKKGIGFSNRLTDELVKNINIVLKQVKY